MSGADDTPENEEPRTVFVPQGTALPGSAARPAPPPQPSPPPPPPTQSTAPRAEGRIEVGDVLNHIFEVTRFIARGGMGEVYEGINVNTDERVAIKVMLPALAADANVQAMFRKEAKTLTRLSHPALVQYRVLAQEPHLKVLYIVTDYIPGSNLSDVLGTVPRDAGSLAGLLRRLADGLRVAHDLGAVHRDIAPDNILLEDGLLDRARVIDFGIAKDLDPSKGTIVGDGFAGKLNYVAPEQLGDFGREVGPWSDIYSLALVILTIAGGQRIDMGATLVDAVDKRRAGVDVSVAPPSLRPVLEAMLRPNPRERLRSMAEVVAMLDGAPVPAAPREAPAAKSGKASKPPKARAQPGSAEPAPSFLARNKLLVAGSAGVGVLALIGITALTLTGGSDRGDAAGNSAAPVAAARPAVDVARDAITAALPGLGCSWLDLHDLKDENGELAAQFGGVAGNTAAAQASLSSAVSAKGVRIAKVDFEDVAPIQPVACSVLDAYRTFKSPVIGDLGTDQVKYEKTLVPNGPNSGQSLAKPQIHISASAMRGDIALIGIETSGAMTVFPDKQTLLNLISAGTTEGSIKPDGSISFIVDQSEVGWSGILIVHGRGPFDAALIAPPPNARGADWSARLEAAAKAQGWKADMVWFKIVDEVPNS